ncbi:MAG TPA: magnesium chelatase, partial [Bacteroidia bacterium]|nr:magnesium chelatase [Bacteroidia bacterium]
PKIPKLEKKEVKGPYYEIMAWFMNLSEDFELTDNMSDEAYRKQLDKIQPLDELILQYHPKQEVAERYFLKEMVLWGLAENNKLSRIRINEGISFSDNYNDLLSGLRT